MSAEIAITFGILAITITLFVTDRLRLDVVAMISLLLLALTKVAPMGVVLSGFSNPAVVMIAGLFVVGAAITQTGLADWLGRRMDRLAGHHEVRVIVLVMGATALLSSFMSSTGTVALLLPVVGTIASRRNIAPGRLLMPLAFAAHLGSNFTLISTPPNLIVSDVLRDAGHEPFRFFSFFVPGAVVFVVGVSYLALLGRRALPRQDAPLSRRSFVLSEWDLAAEYGLASVRVPEGSRLVGRTIGEVDLHATIGITVVGIVRGAEPLRVTPRVRFAAGDELCVLGSDGAVAKLSSAFSTEFTNRSYASLLPIEESLAEVVVPRRSRLVGRTLNQAHFYERYGANVLAVRRVERKEPVAHSEATFRDLTLHAGDTLLVKGLRASLRNLRDNRMDLLFVAEPDFTRDVMLDRAGALGVAVTTFAMLVVMGFGWLPNVIAVLLAALMMVMMGAVRPAEVYRSVNWESVVLIACMIPLATTLERTGGTKLVVAAVESRLHGASPTVVLALLVGITSTVGMVLSNTATAVLVAPVAVRLASAFGLAPEPLLMGVAFASSAAFATPIASPVNVLVMTPGGYRFADYTRVGLPLQILVLATAVIVIPLVWPF